MDATVKTTESDGMIGQFLLAFRETFEAALITAIILSYLSRTKRQPMIRYVWYGVYGAIGASVMIGALIWVVYGGLSGANKALFEGVTALLAVLVLSSMIYWMINKGRTLQREMETRLMDIVTRETTLALISLSFIVVFREGIETVLFLTPFLLDDVTGTLIGAVLGVTVALILAYVIFVVGMQINLQRFFFLTSILLMLLAGGLVGYGVHELVEYSKDVGIQVGWLGEYAYTLNIPVDNPFHHKGLIGSVFAVMLGYTVQAEWARVIAHLAYLVITFPLVIWKYRKPK